MSLHDVISFTYVYILYGQLLCYTSLFEQIEGDTLPELSVAGHGVVLTLLSLLKQTFQKVEGTSSGIQQYLRYLHTLLIQSLKIVTAITGDCNRNVLC